MCFLKKTNVGFDGDTLYKEFWLTGIMLICSQVPFYIQYKEKSESGKE